MSQGFCQTFSILWLSFYKANILTIHQSIPVNGVTLTLSVEVLSDTGDVSNMVEEIEMMKGIHYVKY